MHPGRLTDRPVGAGEPGRSVGRSLQTVRVQAVRPRPTADVQRKPFSPPQCNPETHVRLRERGSFLTYLILDLRELRFTGPPRYGTLSPHEYTARLLLFSSYSFIPSIGPKRHLPAFPNGTISAENVLRTGPDACVSLAVNLFRRIRK